MIKQPRNCKGMGVAVKTVKSHITYLLSKLELRNRAEAQRIVRMFQNEFYDPA
jgi:DNA-binding NarL/FixJ family response regulator